MQKLWAVTPGWNVHCMISHGTRDRVISFLLPKLPAKAGSRSQLMTNKQTPLFKQHGHLPMSPTDGLVEDNLHRYKQL